MKHKEDTPIALANITQMSSEEHEALIERIRERRLAPVRVYEELTLLQAAAKREGLEEILAKQLEMFKKELERADKAIDKLDTRVRKLRVIKLDLEEL